MQNSPMAGLDIISIKNLQLPFGITIFDVWGKAKEQPATLNIQLTLREEGFSTAASKDELDNSTIHYGQLAKGIRASSFAGQSLEDVFGSAEKVAAGLATKEDGSRFILSRSCFEVELPKASMFGDGIALQLMFSYGGSGEAVHAQQTFTVKNAKVMTLVGVNDYERSGKQPLVANIMVSWRGSGYPSGTDEAGQKNLFRLEQTLVQIIEETSFETLETLAHHTVKMLHERVLARLLPECLIWLKLEKPRAIAFADAPAVEVSKQFAADIEGASDGGPATQSPGAGVVSKSAAGQPQLNVIKPYLE